MKDFSIIINRERLLSPQEVPEGLTEPEIPFYAPPGDERRLLEKTAAKAAVRLFTQAALDQIALVGISGYRSYERQKKLYEEAVKRKSRAVAPPGASEHQTGLALDVSCPRINLELEETFGETREGLWLARNAPLYGFILRYPRNREQVTGYPYEPWHIRYVGEALALYLSLTGLTLEEYEVFI